VVGVGVVGGADVAGHGWQRQRSARVTGRLAGRYQSGARRDEGEGEVDEGEGEADEG
jgi:hypothetical protein